jgi:hypothetical protein
MYPAGSRKVYVTASAARSPQEEAQGTFNNPAPLPSGLADTIWLCLGDGLTVGECNDPSEFQRHKIVNGSDRRRERPRAVVLTFDSGNWNKPYRIYIWAVDEKPAGNEIDPRSRATGWSSSGTA